MECTAKGARPVNTRNIALIGFRTTGKSLIGSILAKRLQRTFVDMDVNLVKSLGQDIDSWVRSHGWESFREAESKLLATLARQDCLVVATGGGVVNREANQQRLRRSFVVVWLRASPRTIMTRLAGDPKTAANRPPLTDLPLEEEILHLLEERSPHYAESADFTIDTDYASPKDLATKIQTLLAKKAGIGNIA